MRRGGDGARRGWGDADGARTRTGVGKGDATGAP